MNCRKRHYNKKEQGLELQLKIWKVGYKEDNIDARKQRRLKYLWQNVCQHKDTVSECARNTEESH